METKIKRNIIILVVLTFLLISGMVLGYGFLFYSPLQKKIAESQVNYDARVQVAQTLGKNLQDKRNAEEDARLLAAQLAFFRGKEPFTRISPRYRSLYIDLGTNVKDADPKVAQRKKDERLEATWKRWMNEYYAGYGVALDDELAATALQAGVKYDSKPSIALNAPPKNPEEVAALIPNNGLLKPTTGDISLTIVGDLPSIMRYFTIITGEHATILKVVQQISLTGNSPQIKATFKLTPYLIVNGPDVKITAGGAAPAAAGGEGGAGGPATPGGPGSSSTPGA